MSRSLVLAKGDQAELKPTAWQFYFDLSDLTSELKLEANTDNGETWTSGRMIRAKAVLPFQSITILRADGTSATVFREFTVRFYPRPKVRPAPQMLGGVQVGGGPTSYLVHGSPQPASLDIRASDEFVEMTLEVPEDSFNAAWDELKFGRGKIMAKAEVYVAVLMPVWPDDYFIEADKYASASATSLTILRSLAETKQPAAPVDKEAPVQEPAEDATVKKLEVLSAVSVDIRDAVVGIGTRVALLLTGLIAYAVYAIFWAR